MKKDLEELPSNRSRVGSKWVFKLKTGADGSVERYKARIVAHVFLKSSELTTMKPSVL